MEILEWIGVGVLVLLAAIALLFGRRALVARGGGTVQLYLRLSTMMEGRGWSPGFARFVGEELRWYRMFSFAFRPRRVLARRGLAVVERRGPAASELLMLPEDWVILRCTSFRAPVEIAMAPSTVTGFLSWLEAAPPRSLAI
ncbi:MAG: DUF2550 domain-containing protein [Micromonosporaceae bacterium]|jgi:hypothetical protein|nr:DUF2550 domain-containing protein [Micromonosporaceae bacterium]